MFYSQLDDWDHILFSSSNELRRSNLRRPGKFPPAKMLPVIPLLLLLSTFLFPIPPAAASEEQTATEKKKLIFVLAGQSNMAGRGGVSDDRWDHFVPPECRPTPSILRLSSQLCWEEAREPLHADIDVLKTCGVGPGMPFAQAVLAAGEAASIALVPCAVGGTAIGEWGRGTPLYETLVRRATIAAAAAGGGGVAAVLWYQGESDTVLRRDAEAYGSRMERLVRDLRSDLGQPDLLLIQVALASGEGKFVELVREAQKELKLDNLITVDAQGLQLEPDQLHLTTQSQVKLGSMLAASYLNHTNKHVHSIHVLK
ncbi:putative carbohydrate esterase [Apostasia shenzhenica]|uniref:Putative carbohydrate esterase n=1 Tax=Apostasia shenzhenica TaxID=1088818 RepID=A0A2H9ZWS8_9ASPA|nr:putative carbohydrate esterase [Apostasia shenzhenica]